MDIKLAFLLLVCLPASSFSESKSSPLKLTLYSEGLCPYSHRFVTYELNSTYEKIGDAFEFELIPGWSKSFKRPDGNIIWKCQHGEDECYLNRINACVVHNEKSQKKIIQFLNCQAITLYYVDDYEEVVTECVNEVGLSWDKIKKCKDSDIADKYLLEYEERQKNLNPPLRGVPTLWFNDHYDQDLDENGISNLLKTICGLLELKPSGCIKY